MKKLFFYFLFIIVMIFAMPIIFTNTFETKETVSNDVVYEENKIVNNYDYGSLNNIKLLHTETNEIQEIKLDEYLYGVVAAEMPASYEIEALKAQAVVARTYTMYKIENKGKHENADICDSSLCCQAWISKENRMARWEGEDKEKYWNKIVLAVDSTAGKYITYENKVINALFHSNSGGKTELAINVWGGNYPYLQSVETSGEENYSTYNSEIEVSRDEFIQKILDKNKDFRINFKEEDSIKILEYTDSGRVKKIKIGNLELSGVDVRNILGLKSSNFNFEILENSVKFTVKGYGHGVGLSQSGSDSLAKSGKKYDEIIKHYYKNVEIHE
ncbi:MAG: stage II sporulation protein D [Clostridia bacterium]|nr:stage II sporulation protein D [Clostridia bacterium]